LVLITEGLLLILVYKKILLRWDPYLRYCKYMIRKMYISWSRAYSC